MKRIILMKENELYDFLEDIKESIERLRPFATCNGKAKGLNVGWEWLFDSVYSDYYGDHAIRKSNEVDYFIARSLYKSYIDAYEYIYNQFCNNCSGYKKLFINSHLPSSIYNALHSERSHEIYYNLTKSSIEDINFNKLYSEYYDMIMTAFKESFKN